MPRAIDPLEDEARAVEEADVLDLGDPLLDLVPEVNGEAALRQVRAGACAKSDRSREKVLCSIKHGWDAVPNCE